MSADSGIPQPRPQEVDFAELKRFFKRYRVPILLGAVLFGGGGVLKSWREPPRFGARAVVFTLPDRGDAAVSLLIGRDNATALQMMKGVIQTETATKAIMAESGIKRNIVEDKLDLKVDGLTKQLAIQCDALSSADNMKLVTAAYHALQRETRKLMTTAAGAQAKEYENVLKQRERELQDAIDALVKFAKNMKTGPDARFFIENLRQLEAQQGSVSKQLEEVMSKARQSADEALKLPTSLPNIEPLRQRVLNKRYDLLVAKQTFGDESPRVTALTKELRVAEAEVQKEVQKYIQSINLNIDPATATLASQKYVLDWQLAEAKRVAADAPAEAARYAQLQTEIDIRGDIVKAIRTKWEEAKVGAVSQDIKWSTLDAPYQDSDPSNKKYSSTFMKYGVLGLVAMFMICGFADKFRKKP